MYTKIYVPVDNSEYSNAAADLAIAIAQRLGGEVVASHVYAANLHAGRFRQMEPTLPEKYRAPEALERQRHSHASLIATGLRLISESYLEAVEGRARRLGVPVSRRLLDGKNYRELVRDIRETEPDLVILGALGMGAVKHSALGSVCERVVRRVRTGVLVVKDTLPMEETGEGIVVGIDGSPHSYAGLRAALALGKAFARPVEAVAVYDPVLHGIIFHRMVGVLSEKATRLFRSEEQAQLHEEVIDAGLAKIYRSHLEAAQRLAEGEGTPLKLTLLSGKAFDRILYHARMTKPWLLVLGRIGYHGDEELDIGSTSENLLRLAPCHVLLTSQVFHPPQEMEAGPCIGSP